MTQQYLRCLRLTFGGSGSATGSITCASSDPSPLKVQFRVTHAERAFPQNAVIAIYNLSRETEQKFITREYTKVLLECGYQDNYATVFKGEIIQARLTKERGVDTIVLLTAKDSPTAFEHGTISKSLPKGHSFADQINACLDAWKPFGVTRGTITDFGSIKPPRPRVLHGMVSDKLNEICQSLNANWHVRGGQLHLMRNTETMGDVIVLSSDTGLVGRAEQTIQGIIARCFLNPRIRPKTKVRIDESSIDRGAYSPDYLAKNEAAYPSIAADGIYEVLDVDEVGDTCGQDWYTIAYCLSASGGNIPIGLAPRGIGVISNAK